MVTTRLLQVFISLVLSIRFITATTELPPRPSALLTQTVAAATERDYAAQIAETDEMAAWIIRDEQSHWSIEEAESLQEALQATFGALAANGIDGKALLEGYRFRHAAGLYVGGVEGRMGLTDHNLGEITISDLAFTFMNAFPIYHELGHAVDNRLSRQLSAGFQRYTSGMQTGEPGEPYQTAEDHWLRAQGRFDREEATADAFAVLVMSFAGLPKPVFAHEPATTDYAGIAAAAAQALQNSDLSER